MNEPIQEIKARIMHALIDRGMRAIDLSEKTGIPKSSICQYMSGYSKPKADRIFLMAKALDVSEAWLMGYDVPMEKQTTPRPEDASTHLELISLFMGLSKENQEMVMQMMRNLKKGE